MNWAGYKKRIKKNTLHTLFCPLSCTPSTSVEICCYISALWKERFYVMLNVIHGKKNNKTDWSYSKKVSLSRIPYINLELMLQIMWFKIGFEYVHCSGYHAAVNIYC